MTVESAKHVIIFNLNFTAIFPIKMSHYLHKSSVESTGLFRFHKYHIIHTINLWHRHIFPVYRSETGKCAARIPTLIPKPGLVLCTSHSPSGTVHQESVLWTSQTTSGGLSAGLVTADILECSIVKQNKAKQTGEELWKVVRGKK